MIKRFFTSRRLWASLAVVMLLLVRFDIPHVRAAITEDGTSNASGSDNTSITSLTWAHTNAGSALIASISMNDATDADRVIASVTFNGDAMTVIKRQDDASGNKTVELWGLVNPDIATGNIVVTFNAGSVSQTSAGAISLSGTDTTSPFEANNGVTVSNDSTPSVTVDVVTDQAWIVAGLIRTTEIGTPAIDSPGVEIFKYQTVASMTGAAGYESNVGTGTQTISWTSGGSDVDDYAIAIVSVKPAAGGGGGGAPQIKDESYSMPIPSF